MSERDDKPGLSAALLADMLAGEKKPHTGLGGQLIRDIIERRIVNEIPFATGFTAADERARGGVVDPGIPDEAEMWCYGWLIVGTDARGDMLSLKMQPVRPFWNYITITVTVTPGADE